MSRYSVSSRMQVLGAAALTALLLPTAASASELINNRDACDTWEYIPASEQLGSPETALLFCTRDDRSWMALRIECHPSNAGEIRVNYQPGFAYANPVPDVAEGEQTDAATEETTAPAATLPPKEMVFFDFPAIGYTSVAQYDFDAAAWEFVEKEPLSPLFLTLISGSYADISLLATEIKERLPLRGSGKALRPLVESCRIAKRDAEQDQ